MGDKMIAFFGKKVGDYVEDRIVSAFGGGDDKDKDDERDGNKGGIFSMFGGDKKDKDEDKDKGLFSFGDDKKKDEDKGGFFSKFLDKDDDDRGKDKKSGFAGLFTEGGAAGGGGQLAGGSEQGGGGGGPAGADRQSIGVSDGDLFDDLMNVAEETAKEK